MVLRRGVAAALRILRDCAGHCDCVPDVHIKWNSPAPKIPRFAVFICEHVDACGWALLETAGCSLRRIIRIVLRYCNARNDVNSLIRLGTETRAGHTCHGGPAARRSTALSGVTAPAGLLRRFGMDPPHLLTSLTRHNGEVSLDLSSKCASRDSYN
jgi:hypothetical protein